MIEQCILTYIHGRWDDHKLARKSLKVPKPRLHVAFLSEVVYNICTRDCVGKKDANGRFIPIPPHVFWFTCLDHGNRRRVVQAALDRLVRAGALLPFRARVRLPTGRTYSGEVTSQVFTERCYEPASLLEALAHAAK